jgi:glycosyltransferase involved in cell wall biosynthesis
MTSLMGDGVRGASFPDAYFPHLMENDISNDAQKPLRVGVLATLDLRDRNTFSGTPHNVFQALKRAGMEAVDLSIHGEGGTESPTRSRLAQAPSLQLARQWWRSAKAQKRALEGWLRRPWDYEDAVKGARSLSRRAQDMLDATEVDVLLGICVSAMIYELDTERPIVYASDTTARLVNSSYPRYMKKSAGYKRACDEVEGQAMAKCRYFAAAAQRTAESAVADYGMPPERVGIVEFGAHVLPTTAKIDPQPPSDGALELLLVASDPKRKRLGLCIRIAEALRDLGWDAVLNYVGPEQADAGSSEAVRWHGRLMLSNPDDRRKHEELLSRSHWMLLPSTAEAYGIAPCEAAHFGRPSAVSDVGGLPTVVLDGETGLVLPADADAGEYAKAIDAVSREPELYARHSKAALERARNVLSWDVWAMRMKRIMTNIVQGEEACPQPK